MVASVNLSLTIGAGGPANTLTLTNVSGSVITNYPFQFARAFIQASVPSGNVPQVLQDGIALPTQVDVKCRYPDGSIKHALIACVIPTLNNSVASIISFQNIPAITAVPLTLAQMAAVIPNDITVQFTGTAPNLTNSTIVSALTMLNNSNYTLWTQGQIAQTAIICDDSLARLYDIGFGDGFHPIRPRFYITFWPTLNLANVRFVAESGLTSEIEDTQYIANISVNNSVVYTANLNSTPSTNPKIHWSMSSWTKTYWYGNAPNIEVNINHNLSYLSSTRFLPNYDPAIVPNTSVYGLWSSKTNDIYDGQWNNKSQLQSGMGTAGGRPELAPYPQWNVVGLYTGNWQVRAQVQGMCNIAASFPCHMRETVTGKRLLRSDASGSSTGLGHCMSITDRKTFIATILTYSSTTIADRVTITGARNLTPPWSFSTNHLISPFYTEYVTLGDPWYLNEMYQWAGFAASNYNGANTGGISGRGPTGAEGGISDEVRGVAWMTRFRAETAFIAPDSDPEKTYFTYLLNDAIASQEAQFLINDANYNSTAIYQWAANLKSNFYATLPGGLAANGYVPPLGNWQADGSPVNGTDPSVRLNVVEGIYPPAPTTVQFTGSISGTTLTITNFQSGSLNYLLLLSDTTNKLAPLTYINSDVTNDSTPGTFAVLPSQTVASETIFGQLGSAAVGLYDAIWCEWYLSYGFARLTELGFVQIEPLRKRFSTFQLGMINSDHPELIAFYELPIASPTAWFESFDQIFAALTPGYQTSGLQAYFNSNLTDDGRQIWGMAGVAKSLDQNDPGALTAWNWFVSNVYNQIPQTLRQNDPKWCIVPRTDSNILPPQSLLVGIGTPS
jgi:hypothetical protein